MILLESITGVLKSDPMYGSAFAMVTGPDGKPRPADGKLEKQNLITIGPDGKEASHVMEEIIFADIRILASELDRILRYENPFIKDLFALNAATLVNGARMVLVNSNSGYKGSVGAGRQLDALLLRAGQFQNPGAGAATPRTTWVRAILASGNLAGFIQSATDTNQPLAMATIEALVILGWANPAAQPCSDSYLITYINQAQHVQNLNFETANAFQGDPVIPLKQPLVVAPQENVLIGVWYDRAGSDELRPLGIWFKTANNLGAPATS